MNADDWDARYAERPLVWGSAPNRFVERELAGLAPGRALDLGSGEGRNAIWLASLGWEVVALDFSPVATARARERAAAAGVTVDVRQADVLTTELDATYDLVLVAYLQLPPGERARLLELACNAVAPGGTFLLVAHDRRNVAEGHGGPKDPDVHWSVGEIVEALVPALVVEHATVEQRPVEGAPRPALDAVVRARRAV